MYEYHDCGTFESIVPIDARWTAIRGGPFGIHLYWKYTSGRKRVLGITCFFWQNKEKLKRQTICVSESIVCNNINLS